MRQSSKPDERKIAASKQKREKNRRVEQREGWGRDDFYSDLRLVTRTITDEINSDPKLAKSLRRRRAEAREGKNLIWPTDEEIEKAKNASD